jgi:hypothetical protein
MPTKLQHLDIDGRPATVAFMTAFDGVLVDEQDASVAIVNFDDGEIGYYRFSAEPKTLGESEGHAFHGNQWDDGPGGATRGKYPEDAGPTNFPGADHLTFYHGTSSDALESIKKNGLIPRGSAGADAWAGVNARSAKFQIGDRLTSVFITSNPDAAVRFSGYAKVVHPGSEAIVLQVDIPEAALAKMSADERSSGLSAWKYNGTIPPEWIKGRMTSDRQLTTLAKVHSVFYTFLVDNEPRTLGEGEGHDFHGNQWTTLPSTSDDPAPGDKYFYHATSVDNLSKIATEGITPPQLRKSYSQNPISLTPHLDAASNWSGLLGGGEIALLRVPRQRVRAEYSGEAIEEYDENGDVNPEYDPKFPTRTDEYDPRDEGAELATWHPIKAEHLEVYHAGTWHKLTDVVK